MLDEMRLCEVMRGCLFDKSSWVERCDIMSRYERRLKEIVRRDEISRYEKSRTDITCEVRDTRLSI